MAKIKVALASILAGGGHNALKKFLYEQLAHNNDLELIQFTHSKEYLDKIHNTTSLHFNKLYDFGYNNIPSELVALVTLNLLNECVHFLNNVKPDMVIATHFILGFHFTIAKIFAKNKAVIISCIPDFGVPAPSEFPFNKRIRPDLVMVFDDKTKQGLIKNYNLPEDTIILSGHSPRREFSQVQNKYHSKWEARKLLAQTFNYKPYNNIKPDKISVLVSGGAGGYIKKAAEILKEIVVEQQKRPELLERYQYFIICGDNGPFYEELLANYFNKKSWSNIFPFSWLDAQKYSLVQYASDYPILVSVAPATLSELLATDTGPIIIYSTRGGQETPNLDFILEHNLGLYLPDKKELLQKILIGFSKQEQQLFSDKAHIFIKQQHERLTKLPNQLINALVKQGSMRDKSIIAKYKQNNVIKTIIFVTTMLSIFISIFGYLGIRSLKQVKKVRK